MHAQLQHALRILRAAETDRTSGLKKSQRYALEARGEFPSRVRLSERSVGYVESEVLAWVEDRIRLGRVPPRGVA